MTPASPLRQFGSEKVVLPVTGKHRNTAPPPALPSGLAAGAFPRLSGHAREYGIAFGRNLTPASTDLPIGLRAAGQRDNDVGAGLRRGVERTDAFGTFTTWRAYATANSAWPPSMR